MILSLFISLSGLGVLRLMVFFSFSFLFEAIICFELQNGVVLGEKMKKWVDVDPCTISRCSGKLKE